MSVVGVKQASFSALHGSTVRESPCLRLCHLMGILPELVLRIARSESCSGHSRF